jgi:mannose-1-phosphate guanylyltransferase
MRALLLAAGYGTRLRPITDGIPKCLVPIKGKALLEIWLERLTDAGVDAFIINTHYLASVVEEFIRESPYRDRVTLVNEPHLSGTAGTLIENIDFFQGEDGLLIHADNYCLADFKNFLWSHKNRPKRCVMTMMTFRTDNPCACGIVTTDTENIVTKFFEKVKDPPGNLANGAVYALSAEFINKIGEKFGYAKDFSTEIIGSYVGKIFSHEISETFIDIGTLENYQKANAVV